MRTSLLLFTGLMATTTGCVVYDYDRDCDPDIPCRGDLDWEDADTGAFDDEEPEIPVELVFTPNQAEQGEVFAAVIRVSAGEFDLTSVNDIVVYGDADLLASVQEQDAIHAIFAIDADAELGPVDLVLNTGDANGELMPDAFTIYETGSGHSANGWNTGDNAGSDGAGSDGDCE